MAQVKEELKTLGQTLRSTREELNISLKEAENSTSIRMSYLQAIEQGEAQKLISPIYAQGFLKQYAIYLGLDGEKLLKEHPDLFGRPAKQEFSYGIGTLEMRGNQGAGIKAVPSAFWLVSFAAALVIAWYFARYLDLF